MNPGQMLSYDDLTDVFPDVADIAQTGNSGLIRVTYPADADTATNPVYVSSRAYDDRSQTTGGTAGSALSTYAAVDAIASGDSSLVIPGAEQDDAFRTNVGLFALDDTLTIANVTAVDDGGNVVGGPFGVALNQDGVSGPWSQFPISAAFSSLPAGVFSLRVDVVQGGRAGAYIINIDQKSLDTTFVKGTH